MARGYVVFTGKPADADAYFHAAQLPCPGHTAVAEHMLTCVSDPGLRDRLLQYSQGLRDEVLQCSASLTPPYLFRPRGFLCELFVSCPVCHWL